MYKSVKGFVLLPRESLAAESGTFSSGMASPWKGPTLSVSAFSRQLPYSRYALCGDEYLDERPACASAISSQATGNRPAFAADGWWSILVRAGGVVYCAPFLQPCMFLRPMADLSERKHIGKACEIPVLNDRDWFGGGEYFFAVNPKISSYV